MNMKFTDYLTVEEINMIVIMQGSTRDETLNNIFAAIPEFDEDDLVAIAESCADLLLGITDEQYDECDFSELAEY